MNTLWLKIAGVAVVVVIVIVIIGKFRSGGTTPTPARQTQPEQAEKPKGFYDMAERDKQFLEEPKAVGEQKAEQPQEPIPQMQTQPAQQPAQAPTQPAEHAPRFIFPSDIIKPTTLYFKPLEEIEDIQAQELLPWATTGRSLGRLPVLQYGLMVKACRQIEQRWPDSWYAFRAKQMLEEISERYALN
jgi:hypothetical protein